MTINLKKDELSHENPSQDLDNEDISLNENLAPKEKVNTFVLCALDVTAKIFADPDIATDLKLKIRHELEMLLWKNPYTTDDIRLQFQTICNKMIYDQASNTRSATIADPMQQIRSLLDNNRYLLASSFMNNDVHLHYKNKYYYDTPKARVYIFLFWVGVFLVVTWLGWLLGYYAVVKLFGA